MLMKRYLLIPIIFLGILLLSQYSRGQDPNYTQYFSTPLYYNPAYTGINSGVRARFTFRDQWPTLPVAFKSYYFSADLGDRNLPGSGGLGLYVNSDNSGVGLKNSSSSSSTASPTLNNMTVGLSVAVRIPITALFVSQVGIKAAVVQRKVNWDALVWPDQLDPKYGKIYSSEFVPPDANKKIFPDFGIGGLFQFSNPDFAI